MGPVACLHTVLALAIAALAFAGDEDLDPRWTHIEYGAGNYGSQNGRRVEPVSDLQFGVLRNAIRELVEKKGPNGVIFVNDYKVSAAIGAGIDAKKFALQNGWVELQIRVLPGDYRTAYVPVTDTAHLYHPGIDVFAGAWTRIRSLFVRLGSRAREGLVVATYFNDEFGHAMDRANLEYEIIGPGPAYFFRAGTRAPESDQTLLYRIVSDRPVPNAILAPEGW
ncbi:MAG: hypothetical protein AAB425_10590, partial [Bdellovibrionota bacterium]